MDTTQDIKKEISGYMKIFGALAVLTIVTVAVSFLKVGIGLAVFIAMVIATVKGSLVASFFMHLAHEKTSYK